MRSVERLTRSPRGFREHERRVAQSNLDALLADLAAAAERREPWYVWVRDEWPKMKAPRP